MPQVLIVDDEPMIRQFVRSALATSGYRVLDAETPAQALELHRDYPGLDLLVTDVVMPECSGCDLALRMRESNPRLPVLFISGYEPKQREAFPLSAFLQKPFRIGDLLDCVRGMLAS
ncbi:MAG: response regulator [Acidobacteriota bacterium]|nr:response regulator [Acidobacteriota bacterium]